MGTVTAAVLQQTSRNGLAIKVQAAGTVMNNHSEETVKIQLDFL
jgi:hypothetical protein